MKRVLCVMLGVCVAVAAYAQDTEKTESKQDKKPDVKPKVDDAKALEIFMKADAATKRVKSVKYKASSSASGAAASRIPKMTGTVIMVGEDPSGFDKYYIDFKGEMPDGRKLAGTTGSDADEYFLLDPAKKIAYVDIDESVTGTAGQAARVLIFREFSHPSPFGDEVNGDKRELKGGKKIGDEDCHHLYVVYSGGQGEADWYISKKDFLPRRVDRVLRGGGTLIVTITDLKISPKLDPGIFKVKVPEGWTKTDEPAQ